MDEERGRPVVNLQAAQIRVFRAQHDEEFISVTYS